MFSFSSQSRFSDYSHTLCIYKTNIAPPTILELLFYKYYPHTFTFNMAIVQNEIADGANNITVSTGEEELEEMQTVVDTLLFGLDDEQGKEKNTKADDMKPKTQSKFNKFIKRRKFQLKHRGIIAGCIFFCFIFPKIRTAHALSWESSASGTTETTQFEDFTSLNGAVNTPIRLHIHGAGTCQDRYETTFLNPGLDVFPEVKAKGRYGVQLSIGGQFISILIHSFEARVKDGSG